MDIEELKTFLTLAECRNFTRTAEIQHIVQSTVSNRIRSLEEYTGSRLVLRDKTGVRLTAEGELFLDYARRMTELDGNALREIHMLKHFSDRLNFACVQWMFNHWASDCLVRYSARFPEIALNITIAHSEEIIPMMQNQIFDLALISYRVNAANLICRPFFRTDIVFVGSPEAFPQLKGGIRREDLLSLPLIYTDIWENCLADISQHTLPEGKIFGVHCNMLDNARDFCLAGIGCCFFPRPIVARELAEGSLMEIPILNLPVKQSTGYLVFNRQRMEALSLKKWLELYPLPAADQNS